MQSMDFVVGFSVLKDLLIKTYKIERPRELVRLHFTDRDRVLLMHDYDDHKKIVVLSYNLESRQINEQVVGAANELVAVSLTHKRPASFLHEKFLLNGFFRL